MKNKSSVIQWFKKQKPKSTKGMVHPDEKNIQQMINQFHRKTFNKL